MIKRVFSLIMVCLIMTSTLSGCRRAEKTEEKAESAQITDTTPVAEPPLLDNEWNGEVLITTPYVTLKYPEKWLNYLKVQKNFNEESNVEFYASVGKKQDIKVFTVQFNEDGQFSVGILENSGELVYIAFSYSELAFDETWTRKEIDIVNAMQEEINYVIAALEKEAGFVPEN